MNKIYLSDNWTLSNELKELYQATVPGCVHTDLIAAGLIKDIFWRDNNQNYQWIEDREWEYTCTFDAEVAQKVYLVFEGLDTYAEITLNEPTLGKTDDMFIPHKFDVSSVLKEKENILTVHFFSPVKTVEGKPKVNGAFTTERMYSRRIQCTYGWDWVDRFVTCGIYRPVYLLYENGIDIEDVYIYTDHLDRFGAQICTEINFTDFEQGGLANVQILSPDGEPVVETSYYVNGPQMIRRFDIASPKLWYPNGYGEQPLYMLVVTVGKNRFEEIFGIRTVRVMQLVDEPNSLYWKKAKQAQNTDAGKKYDQNESFSGFQVIVNGQKIFCKGGNWVPCEPFPSAESDEKIAHLVRMAKDMGANFLRVWGGGLFEKKAFYDACDRCGILVAQDFLMACGHYPEKEKWFIDALTKESAFAAKYLRNHPCLAWWHGDNENATKGSDVQTDYTGRDSALRGLAPQIDQYDHTRPFLPSSPYGGNTYASITRGTSHTTNYLGDIFQYFEKSDCTDYKEYMEQFVSRFISEEGTFGAVMRPSMLKFMTRDDLLNDPTEEILIYHTKNNPGLKRHIFEYVRIFTEKLLGVFSDGEDKFFKYKYVQYEWVRASFENVRRNLGYCNGLIFWMFNDCWPAALGWSFIDYYCLPKPAYYSFKRASKPVIGTITEELGKYVLTVSADTEMPRPVSVKLHMLENGTIIKTYLTTTEISKYGTVSMTLPWEYEKDKLIVCDLEYSDGNDRCFYKHGALHMVSCDKEIRVISKSNDSVTLTAKTYVHAVELEGEYMFEDNYFSMLPGETKTIHAKRCGDTEEFTIKAYTLLQSL